MLIHKHWRKRMDGRTLSLPSSTPKLPLAHPGILKYRSKSQEGKKSGMAFCPAGDICVYKQMCPRTTLWERSPVKLGFFKSTVDRASQIDGRNCTILIPSC